MTNKLVLGTVQLGLDYGINNKRGKPSREDSLAILDRAHEGGIKVFDTAYAYGDAEDILGEWMENRGLKDKVSIISKLKPHTTEVKEEIKKSLERLKRNYLDGYLLHTPEYIYNDAVVSALESAKGSGLVKNIGVSIYEEKDALYAVNSGKIDYIQVPYSVFDQRLNKTDFFEVAKKNNVTVFARSAFLQGLMFMKESEVPEHLSEAKEYLRKFDEITKKHGFSRAEAALLFSLQDPRIDYVVFGVDDVGQLKENLRIAQSPKDFSDCMKELRDKFTDIPKSIVMPSLWKTK